ncbi:MAG: hypothetical protein PSN44_01650 [Gammaproteobacteria bacterium]|nr:hypothetical protein [Gammaproteobacteria bacterium]
MEQLIPLVRLENGQRVPQHGGKISRIATNLNWQREIVSGNNAMAKGLYFTAYDHYKIALGIAKSLLKTHQHHDIVPDNLVPAIVVSYLNICDLWEKQNKTTARQGYLCAAFDYLVIQTQTPNLCLDLQEQLRCGLDKVFVEIVEMGDMEIIVTNKKILMTLW